MPVKICKALPHVGKIRFGTAKRTLVFKLIYNLLFVFFCFVPTWAVRAERRSAAAWAAALAPSVESTTVRRRYLSVEPLSVTVDKRKKSH